MSRNGSGTYSLLVNSWNPANNGTPATAADYQALINDIAAAITQSLSKDGQTAMTGNLPAGGNKITGLAAGTTAGDSVRYEQVGALALAQGVPSPNDLLMHGRCQLTKSAANLILLPKDGNTLRVNGVLCTVPDAGVTLAAPATTNTTYLIYALATAGVITSLEASATAHATSTTAGNKGIEIKLGDDTRTLVGIARTVGSAWVDTITQRFVRSYFNRQAQNVLNAFTTLRSTTALSTVEVNTEIRNGFLCWADDGVTSSIQGTAANNSANIYTLTTIGWDGVADANTSNSVTSATGLHGNCSTTGFKTLAEGYHYTTLMGAVSSASTGSWLSGFAGIYPSLSTQIR